MHYRSLNVSPALVFVYGFLIVPFILFLDKRIMELQHTLLSCLSRPRVLDKMFQSQNNNYSLIMNVNVCKIN